MKLKTENKIYIAHLKKLYVIYHLKQKEADEEKRNNHFKHVVID